MSRTTLAVALAAVVLGTACTDPAVGKTDRELYEAVCARCHGVDLEGGIGPALGPGSRAETLTDDQLRGVIEVGPGAMPSFRRLDDDQVDSLVAYLRRRQRDR
ncbi:MAG TPA: cytochrome c [Actinobacteria bacterium]|nr:cytochrome c [Actinomycetota bacterium]